jgi:HK97 family phage major capsid protein
MFIDKHLTRSARALIAAGFPVERKDAPDPFDLVTKQLGAFTNETTKRIEGAEMTVATVVEQVAGIEQKLALVGGGSFRSAPESWGETFVRQKGVDLARVASERGRTSLEIKATITSATTDADGSAGALVVPHRDQILGMPRRRMTIRDLLNVVQVTSGSVEYAAQVGRNNNAAPVAEGATKPQSDLQYELLQLPTRVIAHWVKASRQILEDVPQLRDLIDGELRYGVALAEEAQLLSGDGTGQNLNGIIPQATAFADPLSLTSPTMIDMIGAAILQVALTNIPPDGIVVHPADWWRMRLTKDGDGKYILGDPMTVVQPSLFGLPLIPTQAMAVDTFLVGAFGAQTLYDRWAVRVETGFEGQDFVNNMVTLLAEIRVGFAVKRPASMVVGDFGNVA